VLRSGRWRRLALVACAALSGCMREASDLDQHRPLTAAAGRWSLQGIRPREAFAAHQARLGPPSRTVADARPFYEWERPRLTLSVDAAGAIVEVGGDSIDAGGRKVVWPGLSEAELTRILGRGRMYKVTSPGSGVISIGGTETGRVLLYDDDGIRFELELENDALVRVHAFVPRPGAPGSGR
jgi:hypothetical protein